MSYKYNAKFVSYAKALRKNMTPEEKHLWYDFLKKLPLTVNRQKNVGNYILDFYIASKRLAIEIDGSQHYDPEKEKADKQRDKELLMIGIKTVRYKNSEINNNFIAVCEDLLKETGLAASDLRN